MVDGIYWKWCLDTLRWDCRFTLAIVNGMSWECRLFLAMMYDGVCNLPFYLAICASVFGAFSISNRVQRLHIDTGVLESDLRIYGVRYWGQALLIWPMGLGCPRLPFGEVGYVEWLQAGYILCDMIVCDKID